MEGNLEIETWIPRRYRSHFPVGCQCITQCSEVLRAENQSTTVVSRASRTNGQETPRFVGHHTHGSQTGDNMIGGCLLGYRERQRVTKTWKNLEVWPRMA